MKIYFLPKTKSGKWSIALIIAMFLLFVLGTKIFLKLYETVAAGRTILDDIIKRPGLALTMLFGFGAGITAFITGFRAIKNKDWAVLVFIATIIGALLILFLMAELIFPH